MKKHLNDPGLQHFMNTVAKNVHLIRKRSYLSVRNFANEIGIGNSTLLDLEGGVGNPTLKTIYHIMEYCKISPKEIFVGYDAETSFSTISSLVETLRKHALECSAMADFLEESFSK